jgi:4a-hydroxytetrahydrobiopterin dehydratase
MSDAWKVSEKYLSREFKFKNFREAMSFMFLAAFEAEKLDHHPDWKNVYNRVIVELTTHDKGAVTDKDHALAAKLDAIYSKFE